MRRALSVRRTSRVDAKLMILSVFHTHLPALVGRGDAVQCNGEQIWVPAFLMCSSYSARIWAVTFADILCSYIKSPSLFDSE